MANFAGQTFIGADEFGRVGQRVSAAGDINGDGTDDYVVTSTSYSDGNSGEVYVVYGTADGPATLSSDELDGTNGFLITSVGATLENGDDASSVGLGSFIADLGDVNGDGIDDLGIAGRTQGSFYGGDRTSAVYVVYGSNSFGSSFTVADLDGSNGFAVQGLTGVVRDIASAGDVNGDEKNDILISHSPAGGFYGPQLSDLGPVAALAAPDADYSGFVLFGGTNLDTEGDDGVVDIADIDGSNGFAIATVPPSTGIEIGSVEAGGVIAIGDVNNDGNDDLFIQNVGEGAYYGSVQTEQYILFGTDAGFPEVVDPAAGGAIAVDYEPARRTSAYGYNEYAIAGIGDVNGDGFDDIAISDTRGGVDSGGDPIFQSGATHVLFGSANGPATALSVEGPANASEGFTIFNSDTQVSSFERGFGVSLSAAGDVNGDGFADFLVSTPEADSGEAPNTTSDVGQVHLILGRATFDLSIDLAALSQGEFDALAYQFDGTDAFGNAGFSISAAGDVNNDGNDDFILSAPGAADQDGETTINSVGKAYVVHGGTASLEAADNADGTDDNVINLDNLDTDVDTGETPTNVSIDSLGVRSVVEGDTGDTNTIEFTLRRDGDLNRAVSVDFAVEGANFRMADADDFDGGTLPSGSVAFASGSDTATIAIDIQGDDVIESNEDFKVTLTGITAGGISPANLVGTTAFGRIETDDFPPSISVSGPGTVNESAGTIEFIISRVGDTSDGVEVTYDLNPSPAPGDFFAADSNDIDGVLPSYGNTVTFAAGQTSISVPVDIIDDAVIEPRESFQLQITSITVPNGTLYDVGTSRANVTIRNNDGTPPTIPPGFDADIYGDPHLVTLDGLGYDFQAVGEYVLLETTDPADPNAFQIQARFEPVEGSELASVTSRMAIVLKGRKVEIDANAANPLLIDGEPAELTDGGFDLDGDGTDEIGFDGDGYIIALNPVGEAVKVGVGDGVLNICVFLTDAAGGHGAAGVANVQGLLGNADGDFGNEFSLRNGSAIPASEIRDNDGVPELSFDFMYGRGDYAGPDEGYANSWKLSGDEANFTGPAGNFPAGFPAAPVSINDLPDDVRAIAEQAALDAGVDQTNTEVFEAAVLDFALTGDTQFFDIANNISAQSLVGSEPFDAPELPATFGILPATLEITEGDSGEQDVSFIIYRAGDDSSEASFNYTISGVDADDLADGESLTGSVTFGAGITSQTLEVTVTGDTDNEDDEALTVTLEQTSGDGLAANLSATTTVVTDDFAPIVTGELPADASTDEDESYSFTLPSDLFVDRDGDPLTLDVVLDSGPAETEIMFDGDTGEVTITPPPNYNGPLSFAVTASDGFGSPAMVIGQLAVNPVNDDPVVLTTIDDQTTEEDVPFVFTVPAGTFDDVDGDELTLSVSLGGGAPVGASAEIAGDEVTVTSPGDFNGAFEVTVSADDGNGGMPASSTFLLTVTPENDDPIVVTEIADQTTNEDEPFVYVIPAGTFADIDGDDIAIAVALGAAAPAGATADLDVETNEITVTTPQDFVGVFDVIVTASDGMGGEVSDTFALTVDPVNDDPVANDDSGFNVDEGASLEIAASDLLDNDTDVDGDDLTIVSVSDAQNGSVVLSGDTITFTADGGTDGPASFLYTLSDGSVEDSATVSLTVDPVDENPYADYDIQGTNGRDNLFGNLFSENSIFGAGGRDRLFGGIKDDKLAGGAGNDRLYGKWGDDLLEGNEGRDKLYGSFGNDILAGGAGRDNLYGGWGADIFVFGEGDGHDIVRDFSFGYSHRWWGFEGDKLQIDIDGIETAQDVLDVASRQGRHTVFDFGDGDELVVRNTRPWQFDSDDFIIV